MLKQIEDEVQDQAPAFTPETLTVEHEAIAEHGPFRLTHTGALVTRRATFEEWEAATAWVQQVERASPWWVADLVAYGEANYGEKYTQALEATGLDVQTLMNTVYVGKHVPPERRRKDVPFALHAEVASLEPHAQEEFLDRCETNGLTRAQLRVEVKAHQARTTGKAVTLWLMVECKDLADLQDLAHRLELEGRVVKQTAERAS